MKFKNLNVLKTIALMLTLVMTITAVPVTAFASSTKSSTIRDEIVMTGNFNNSVLCDENYEEGDYPEGCHPGKWDNEWIDMVLDIHVVFSKNDSDVNLDGEITFSIDEGSFLFVNEMNWDNVYFAGSTISVVPKEMWLFRAGTGAIVKNWDYYNGVVNSIPIDYETTLPKEQADEITGMINNASSIGTDEWASQEQFDMAVKELEDYLNTVYGSEKGDYSKIESLLEVTNYANLSDGEKFTIVQAYNSINKNYKKNEQSEIDKAYNDFMNTIVAVYDLVPQYTEICDYTEVVKTIKTIETYKDLYTENDIKRLTDFYKSFNWKLGKSEQNQFTVDSNRIQLKDQIDMVNTGVVNAINQDMRNLLNEFYSIDSSKYEEFSYNKAKTFADKQSTNATLENIRTQKNNIEKLRKLIDELVVKVIVAPANYEEVERYKKLASEIDRSIYTEESLELLDNAISAVIYDLKETEQQRVNQMALDIRDAYNALRIKNADYTAVREQIQRFEALNKTEYTEESLNIVTNIIDSIQWNLLITIQNKVDKYASELKVAIDELELKPADFTCLDKVIATLPEDYFKYYDNIEDVQKVIAKINRNATVKEQEEVDKWANELEVAISKLKLKSADYTELNKLMESIPDDLTIYSRKSVDELNGVVNNLDYNLTIHEQDKIDEMVEKLKEAINGLTLKKTVYKSVVGVLESLDGELKELFTSVDELIDSFKDNIAKTHKDAIVEIHNVDVLSNTDEEGWVNYEGTLKDEIQIVLPYPENVDKDNYDFYVYHMFAVGEKAGEIETLEVEMTNDGLVVYSEEFSPYAVVAVEKTEQEPGSDDNEGVVVPDGSTQQPEPEQKPTEDTKSPQTGDHGFAKELLALFGSNMALLGMACVSLKRKKESE